MNRRSNVHWDSKKPDIVTKRHLHSPRVTAWFAMNNETIVGPFFFEDGTGTMVTVNKIEYRSLLRRFTTSLRRRGVGVQQA